MDREDDANEMCFSAFFFVLSGGHGFQGIQYWVLATHVRAVPTQCARRTHAVHSCPIGPGLAVH